ncbi:beta-1,3-galactosyltransferase 4-like [Panulirus ornatus]|uniref:beta-1,3-galactosyltransferase 4-like n=1 Tax=Panulirus ornatus TaxID=150431 RepID=UPI003A885543
MTEFVPYISDRVDLSPHAKGVSALQWINQHCLQAKWILKSDDDMVINVFGLVSYLGHYSRWTALAGKGLPSKILCAVWWGMPVLRGEGCAKWCVSMDEWAEATYPTYCSGSAFVIPTHLAPRLYQAYFDAPFLWVDDAYISGVLAKEAGIKHQHIHALYELNHHLIEENLVRGNRLFCHHPGSAAPRATWWPLIAAKEGQR